MKPPKKLIAIVGALAASILVTTTPPHEGGPFFKPYKDPVGIPTVCWGHTGKDVIWGKVYTLDECEKFFDDDMSRHATQVLKCTPNLKDKPYFLAAAADFDFNNGKWCQSMASQYMKKGDFKNGCMLMNENFNGNPQWVYATDEKGNKVKLRGLEKRRADFRRICESGL